MRKVNNQKIAFLKGWAEKDSSLQIEKPMGYLAVK